MGTTNYARLGEVCKFENGDRSSNYPNKKDFVDEGIPFIRGGDIDESGLNYLNLDHITTEKYISLRAGKAKYGDLLMSLRGSLNKVIMCPFREAAIASALVILKPNESIVLKDYLYYVITSSYFSKLCENYNNGSVQANLSVSVIKDFLIPIPSIEEQKNFLKIIKTLDKKINNNSIINTKLEDYVKTIYHYWFLQFDFPDTNSHPYKTSGRKMIYDDVVKREIPENWKAAKVKDIISHINTGLNPRQNFVLNNGDIRYITVKNLTTKGTIDFTTCDTIDEEALKKVHKRSDISKGDILFASIAPLGRCVIIREDPNGWDINESVFSIRPKSKNLSEYLYMFFMSEAFIKKAEQSSTGSVFSGIRISVLEDMKIVVPPEDILDKFNQIVSPIFDLKYRNELENQKLKELRDFLLPLLLNGQVTITDES